MLLLYDELSDELFMYYYNKNNILMFTGFSNILQHWAIPIYSEYSTIEQAKHFWRRSAKVIHEE